MGLERKVTEKEKKGSVEDDRRCEQMGGGELQPDGWRPRPAEGWMVGNVG